MTSASPLLYKIFETKVSEDQTLTNAIRRKSVPQIIPFHSEPSLFLLFCRKARIKPWDKESQEYLVNMIEKMRDSLDYVVVDSGPMALVPDSEEYAGWMDACLLVIHQDMMEASYINDAIDNLEDTGSELIGCVLNGMRRGVLGRAKERSNYYGSAYGNDSHYRKVSASGGERRS